MAEVSSYIPFKVSPGRSRPAVLSNGCVLTIGAFDGVHLGHQQMIQRLRTHGRCLGLPSVALTFRPDPGLFFGGQPVAALMSWREKMCRLKETGVDYLGCIPFNRTLSEMTPKAFVEQLLVEQLGVKLVQVGDDFRFGAKRQGDYQYLNELGQDYGFDVARSETYEIDHKRVSSTRIRELLSRADLSSAEKLLGRPYQISGRVVKGQQLGRQLGFPTANIVLKRAVPALKGVFVVVALLPDGSKIPAVANIGYRPAVNSLQYPLLEVHLLDYNANLYGQRLTIEFKEFLRDELHFDGLKKLQAAIAGDVSQARKWFEQNSFLPTGDPA